MVTKLGKLQRSKQRCKDLSLKVHDPVQSFVLRSSTMHGIVMPIKCTKIGTKNFFKPHDCKSTFLCKGIITDS